MVLANPERWRPLDIAIAGCGPAGLAAALLLHRDGHRVTMFERFDRQRALGSGLSLARVEVLARDVDRKALGDKLRPYWTTETMIADGCLRL